MSESLSDGEADGLRFLLHVFYCNACPPVRRAGDLVWFEAVGTRWQITEDFRQAEKVAAVAHDESSPWWKHDLCQDGFEKARAAFARGWGS